MLESSISSDSPVIQIVSFTLNFIGRHFIFYRMGSIIFLSEVWNDKTVANIWKIKCRETFKMLFLTNTYIYLIGISAKILNI